MFKFSISIFFFYYGSINNLIIYIAMKKEKHLISVSKNVKNYYKYKYNKTNIEDFFFKVLKRIYF